MGSNEPAKSSGSKTSVVQRTLGTSVGICTIVYSLLWCTSYAHAGSFTVNHFNMSLSGLTDSTPSLVDMVSKAKRVLTSDKAVFEASRAIGDQFSTTIRFKQSYKGLEVVGGPAMVHFDPQGKVHDITGGALDTDLDTKPGLSAGDGQRILADRYQTQISLSSPAKLKVLKGYSPRPRLVYHYLTKSTRTHSGQEVYLDAKSGEIVLEFDRALDVDTHVNVNAGVPRGKRTVYSADTEFAHQNTDAGGYPTDINFEWYDKVIEDNNRTDKVDRSSLNAWRNAGTVYAYYKMVFGRRSFDDKDTRLLSVVHMGEKMANAFWTSEFNLMAYGDGDDEHLTDLTYGLDVAAHEITHGVTSATANLVYAAEPGALNESYSDVFAKMVDWSEDDWDIGARVMAPAWGRRALRNMKNPEEFKQPGTNDSPHRIPTTGPCTRQNDRCGVHVNSGIPNRAAVLIVESIGKQKTEQIYYKVLTSRLTETSTFKDARRETEATCDMMFGKDSDECGSVRKAFDTVKM